MAARKSPVPRRRLDTAPPARHPFTGIYWNVHDDLLYEVDGTVGGVLRQRRVYPNRIGEFYDITEKQHQTGLSFGCIVRVAISLPQ